MNHRLSYVGVAALAIAGLVAWVAFAAEGPDQEQPAEALTTATFHVTGMTCGGCEVGVRRVVKKLDGVEEVEASHREETAVVTYRAGEVTPEDIIAAIEELGYAAQLAGGEDEDA